MYEFIKSPNFWPGRARYKPLGIVIHIGEGSATAIINTFRNPQTQKSAHYLVTKTGKIYQFVKEKDTAWHSGQIFKPSWELLKPGVNPNLYTIGIEFEGFSEEIPTLWQVLVGSWLIKKISANWAIPLDTLHVIGHNQIRQDKLCPGEGISVGCLVWLAELWG